MSLGWTMGYKDIINNYNDNTIKYIDGIYDNSNSYTGNGIYKDLFSTYFLDFISFASGSLGETGPQFSKFVGLLFYTHRRRCWLLHTV